MGCILGLKNGTHITSLGERDNKMVGLTLGKFLPFHKGHELLIQTASAVCDQLIVLVGVSDDDPYSFEQRADWIRAADVNHNLHIMEQKELDKNAPKDKDGTITDESYWIKWLEDTKRLIDRSGTYTNKITNIFTSDLYGERIAKELGAKWIPIDPDREIIPTSGTKVRSDIEANFCSLPSYVRKDLVKTVAILGPESVGKSTIIQKLSKKYMTVPEYGRILSVNRKNDIDFSDF
ncbi:MAG TPA: adenylyltransferase/cytidyltransferase family protein, partial [Candidatus Dojkabacteria bacterium]|nr:adenylyltransferase/cytidyltransferase family protein [Candidatus Dojkabacteria bacterium]